MAQLATTHHPRRVGLRCRASGAAARGMGRPGVNQPGKTPPPRSLGTRLDHVERPDDADRCPRGRPTGRTDTTVGSANSIATCSRPTHKIVLVTGGGGSQQTGPGSAVPPRICIVRATPRVEGRRAGYVRQHRNVDFRLNEISRYVYSERGRCPTVQPVPQAVQGGVPALPAGARVAGPARPAPAGSQGPRDCRRAELPPTPHACTSRCWPGCSPTSGSRPARRTTTSGRAARGSPLRRHFVPVPDHVRAVLARTAPGNEPLLDALERALHELRGVDVPRDAWQLDRLPEHLRTTFQVVDEQQRVLAEGRISTRCGSG